MKSISVPLMQRLMNPYSSNAPIDRGYIKLEKTLKYPYNMQRLMNLFEGDEHAKT